MGPLSLHTLLSRFSAEVEVKFMNLKNKLFFDGKKFIICKYGRR